MLCVRSDTKMLFVNWEVRCYVLDPHVTSLRCHRVCVSWFNQDSEQVHAWVLVYGKPGGYGGRGVCRGSACPTERAQAHASPRGKPHKGPFLFRECFLEQLVSCLYIS